MNEFLREVREMVTQLVQGDEEVANWVKRAKAIDSVQRIPGDASTRRYYRVSAQGRSYILMRMESFAAEGHNLPFLTMQKHMFEAGIDVPQVLDADAEQGFILLEDLGDVDAASPASGSLQRRSRAPSLREGDRLARAPAVWHRPPARRRRSRSSRRIKLRFDHEKLMWEVNFCIEHFYEGYLKRKIARRATEDDQGRLQRDLPRLWPMQPTVLTHRDFHSRNVMVTAPRGGADRSAS